MKQAFLLYLLGFSILSSAQNIPDNHPAKPGQNNGNRSKNGTLFIPTADFEAAETGSGRAKMIPGTFKVAVVNNLQNSMCLVGFIKVRFLLKNQSEKEDSVLPQDKSAGQFQQSLIKAKKR